ncbi:MAG: HD domain-containing protein [Candidatus Micrarchaeota archaeon]|nr:HD domain-containing protein [Candidatus Micrarchaeota archaeon]
MDFICNNLAFVSDYKKMQGVSLNPERHTASNALEHTEMVVKRAQELSELNKLALEEKDILINLSYVHDIGKISGNAKPEESVKLLEKYGKFDAGFVNLVKYHDINLPWYLSHLRGEAPSEKAWRKLLSKVNLSILCIFMVADRADCPGGWRQNKALVWFLEEVKTKNLLPNGLITE